MMFKMCIISITVDKVLFLNKNKNGIEKRRAISEDTQD